VIDHGPRQAITLGGQFGDAVRRVGQNVGGRRAAETLLIDGGLEQRIEGRGNEHVELGDGRQLLECLGRRERGILEDAAQPDISFFAPAACAQEPAHDVVERVRLR
jgi:hypothetical protein